MAEFESAPTAPLAFIPPSPRPSFRHIDRVRFERAKRGPNPADAYWLAESALLAYARPEGRRWYAQADREFGLAFAHPKARATDVSVSHGAGKDRGANWYLISAKEFNLLVFRGSEVFGHINDTQQFGQILKDWVLTNGRFLPGAVGQDVGAHTGFVAAYREVEKPIRTALRNATNPNARLFITGHSLGGAMAVLASGNLRGSFGLITCYTFGAPRVGDRGLVQALDGLEIYRYELGEDLVTRVPPRGFGYRHYPADATHFDQVLAKASSSSDGMFSDVWYALNLGLFKFTSVVSLVEQLADGQLDAAALAALRPIVDHAPVLYAIATYNDWLRSMEG